MPDHYIARWPETYREVTHDGRKSTSYCVICNEAIFGFDKTGENYMMWAVDKHDCKPKINWEV